MEKLLHRLNLSEKNTKIEKRKLNSHTHRNKHTHIYIYITGTTGTYRTRRQLQTSAQSVQRLRRTNKYLLRSLMGKLNRLAFISWSPALIKALNTDPKSANLQLGTRLLSPIHCS